MTVRTMSQQALNALNQAKQRAQQKRAEYTQSHQAHQKAVNDFNQNKAVLQVLQRKQALNSIKKLADEVTKNFNDWQMLSKLTSEANSRYANALASERARFLRVNGDPHYIGLDGSRYDYMPNSLCQIYKSVSTGSGNPSVIISAQHKTLEKGPTDTEPPSFMTAIFIKALSTHFYFDVDENLLVNSESVPINSASHFIDQVAYCWVGNTLTISILGFGTIAVDNSAKFNLNLLLVKQTESFKEPETSEADLHQIAIREPRRRMEVPSHLREILEDLSEDDVQDLLYDYQRLPPQHRDKILEENVSAVYNQSEVLQSFNAIGKEMVQVKQSLETVTGFTGVVKFVWDTQILKTIPEFLFVEQHFGGPYHLRTRANEASRETIRGHVNEGYLVLAVQRDFFIHIFMRNSHAIIKGNDVRYFNGNHGYDFETNEGYYSKFEAFRKAE